VFFILVLLAGFVFGIKLYEKTLGGLPSSFYQLNAPIFL